jgi:3',5'-cyclic AMP phosphodiesterase CpdA
VSFSIVHISDPHFGASADLALIRAAEELVPDLGPRAIVVSGDLTQRARHGEFQAALAFVHELERTAPVMVIPGNHDVQWWTRPYVPGGMAAKYRKYMQYFGPHLTPTMRFPEAVMASVLTSHGLAWGSLTLRPRDMAVKGHLSKREVTRATRVLADADPDAVRILVVHHNVLRGQISDRMGLARWRQAERRLASVGADVALCGHDHQEMAGTLYGGTVVSGAGTLSTRSRGGRPAVFNRVTVDDDAVAVEFYTWELDRKLFRRTEASTFPRPTGHRRAAPTPAAVAP